MEVQNQHEHSSAFGMMNSLEREGLVVASRRNALKASLAGLCGLSFPEVLHHRALASERKAAEKTERQQSRHSFVDDGRSQPD